MKVIVLLCFLAGALASSPEENLNIGRSDVNLVEGDIAVDDESRGSVPGKLWPNGVFVYDIESSLDDPTAKRQIQLAMDDWRKTTCITFKKRTTETDYVSFFKGSGCWSYVGRTGRKQQLSLASGCWGKGTIIHEIGHALGFLHEQSRPDRDTYVDIKFENIQSGKEGNFRKSSSVDSLGTTYDYGSIMHYGARYFSKNGQPTIVPKKAGVTIGNRADLSPIDIKQMNLLYKCSGGGGAPPPAGGFSCNFDTDLCGFTHSRNDKFDWTRRSGSTPSSSTGPSADHSGKGSYIYIETSSPRVQGDNAKLYRTISLTGSSCLSFYYHMYGSTMGSLKVTVEGKQVFSKSGNQGNTWSHFQAQLSGSGSKLLEFEGIRGSSYTGDAAIDDVRVFDCQGFSCNFDRDDCGFNQKNDDKFDFTRKQGGTPSSGTGPSGDHTSGNGFYMYIETSSPRVSNDNAKISKQVSLNGNACLSFYYHMNGNDVGTLYVRVGGREVFMKKGSQGNSWMKAEVRLSDSGSKELEFEGVRGANWQGDIAIDDVSISACGGPPPPPPGSCGVRPNTRIVGGVAAKHGDWPWQAMLRTSSGSPYCGGTLVAPQWVVTATHCVQGKSPNSVFIRLGAHRRTSSVGTEQDFKVIKVITHPDYHKPKRYAHDIALLKLEKPAQLNKNVNLACLPQAVAAPGDGVRCWITGWGRLSSGGSTPNILQQVSVPVTSRARCEKSYPGKIHDSMICAGLDQGGIDSCQGDSGGPMVCETGGRYYLHGVTSWGYGCASAGKFGVYSKVKYTLKWLNSEMSKN